MSERITDYNPEEMYEAEVIADSVNQFGDRITTIEATFPRMILSEFNTHRVFSRNSASSRAIPTHQRLEDIMDRPYIPVQWGKYQPGMSSRELLSPENQVVAEQIWLQMRDQAVLGVIGLMGGIESEELAGKPVYEKLMALISDSDDELRSLEGEALHKQWVNRPLEPFMWHKVIVTSTEWENFYALRISEYAQPEINRIAQIMLAAYEDSEPQELQSGEWHTPYIREQDGDLSNEDRLKISTARSARVSYQTHRGVRDIEKDVSMHDSLKQNGHMSPFEHPATPFTESDREHIDRIQTSDAPDWIKRAILFDGNFRGWHSYRKMIPNEDNYAEVLRSFDH